MKSLSSKRSKLLSLMLVLAFMVGMLTVPSQSSSAASKKATLSSNEYYMACGLLQRNDNFFEKNVQHCINVENPVKKATYSFTSSDTKVLKLIVKGTKCYLNGLKPGKATVTCNQKLNGKTTKVGTCKVKIDKATVRQIQDTLCVGDNVVVGDYDSVIQIDGRNTNAKYTYKSNSKDFTMSELTEKVESYSPNAYIYVQKYTAKKPGTYTVTVNETVGKSSKKVGSFKIKVEATEFEKTVDAYTGETIDAMSLIHNPYNNDYSFYSITGADFDINDKDAVIAYDRDEYDNLVLTAKKAGTATLNIIETKSKKQLASVTVTIKEMHVEDLEMNLSENYYLEDGPCYLDVVKVPDLAPEEVKMTVSDSKIATVKYDEDEELYELTPKKVGKVTLTITCGTIERKVTINIVSEDDE